jgi:putative restriction endonuclease
VSEQLCQLPIFLERNSTGHTMYSNALARYAEYLDDSSSSDEIEQDIDAILTSKDLSPTEKAAFVKARMGQGVFRKKLIDYWKGCSVTAFPRIDLLVASHIKPWKASSNFERLDVFNGLLLLPNLDRAFELGYISFNEKGMIIISPTLGHPELIGIDSAMRLDVAPEHRKYLDYHRTWKFKKDSRLK